MHDQRKVRGELDEKSRQFQEEKIERFRTVYDNIFDQYRRGNLSRDVLGLLNVLLEISPEQYTFFGYRRKILLHAWATTTSVMSQQSAVVVEGDGVDRQQGAASPDAQGCNNNVDDIKARDLEEEYALNTAVIMKDFKVYSAFVHRRWILSQMDAQRRRALLQGELKKCESLLKLDDRNFHAWGYRRWVTDELRQIRIDGGDAAPLLSSSLFSDQDEWTFTDAKINQNFSNYSAWHNRALLMEGLAASASAAAVAKATTSDHAAVFETRAVHETELAIKAFYCDPNDQSAWLYAAFLLRMLQSLCRCTETAATTTSSSCYAQVLRSLVVCCDELASECASEREEQRMATEATNADIGAPAVVQLSGAYVLWMQWLIVSEHSGEAGIDRLDATTMALTKRWGSAANLLKVLIEVDPMRAGMYQSMSQEA
jgi:geranylgeranyl transferase type-2 subunit alpha